MKKIDFGKVLSKIKSIKITAVDITVLIVVLILSCVVIVPSLFQCVANRNKAECSNHMSEMLNILQRELTEEVKRDSSFWHDLIKNGNYQKLVATLNEKTGKSANFPSSHYYIKTGDEKLSILCKKHKDISEKTIKFSLIQDVSVEVAEKTQIGENIVYLSVTGPDTYYQNESLNADNPSRLVFRGNEVDKAIQNLTVTAVYAGGAREVLPRSSYTISAKKIDMSKSGQVKLLIKFGTKTLWNNSAYTSFVIDIIGEDDLAPLIVDGGLAGRYELASWEWSDYVEESSLEDGGKIFGASIIRHNGDYYYYPDGFEIKNDSKNANPFKYAVDIDDNKKPAYYIEFDVNSVIINADDEKNVHNGSVKVENNLVYIWQKEPSKELDAGWIRVYCDLKKY